MGRHPVKKFGKTIDPRSPRPEPFFKVPHVFLFHRRSEQASERATGVSKTNTPGVLFFGNHAWGSGSVLNSHRAWGNLVFYFLKSRLGVLVLVFVAFMFVGRFFLFGIHALGLRFFCSTHAPLVRVVVSLEITPGDLFFVNLAPRHDCNKANTRAPKRDFKRTSH